MDSIFKVRNNRYGIRLNYVNINGRKHKTAIFVVRLLSYKELERYDGLDTSSMEVEAYIEEDVFKLVFEGLLGSVDTVDVDTLDAGIVTTVARTVLEMSANYILKPDEMVAAEKNALTEIDKVNGIVSKAFNLDISTVENMPINQLYKYFALNFAIREDIQAVLSNQHQEQEE